MTSPRYKAHSCSETVHIPAFLPLCFHPTHLLPFLLYTWCPQPHPQGHYICPGQWSPRAWGMSLWQRATPTGAFWVDRKWWHLSRTWLACWILTTSHACVVVCPAFVCPITSPWDSLAGQTSMRKLAEQKDSCKGLWLLIFNYLFPFPVDMGEMELQHPPCSPAKALSESNRATGDRHSGRVSCFTSDIRLCKQERPFTLQRASKVTKRTEFRMSPQHLTKEKLYLGPWS